ncbi:MAG: PH domain-containing protein [Theionarchaea archaeon]|nr:PH domain-containing protein [Theionarchaea archaeon]
MDKEVLLEDGLFKPAPQFKTLYYVYLVLVVFLSVFTWYIPVAVFAPSTATFYITICTAIILIPVVVLTLYWIPTYYNSMIYQFTNTEIEWRRGVWFKKTGIVPYNRITNVDVEQGPLSRRLGVASLKIQTAGYSAPSGAGGVPEMKIVGVEQFEELRSILMAHVRGKKPVAVETYEEDTSSRMLEELTKLRKLLEEQKQ